jgi:hypothetical protein
MGPPERRNPGTPARATSTTPIADTDHNAETDIKPGRTFTRPATPKPLPRICANDVPGQLRARRAESRRLPVGPCGRHSDPLVCTCFEPDPPLSEHAIEGWRAAIERILPIGPPLVPIEVLQHLWRLGGSDRQLAERVWRETGGRVA